MNTYQIGDYSGIGGGERSIFATQPTYQADSHMEALKLYLKEKNITNKIQRSGRDGSNHFVVQKIIIKNDKVYLDYSDGVCQRWYEFVPHYTYA